MSKYKARRRTYNGMTFDSGRELKRYRELELLQKAGRIGNLERQVKIVLRGRDGPIKTDSGKRDRTYVADFRYVDWDRKGLIVIEDAKGHPTPEYKLKKAILAAQGVEIFET